MNKIVLISAFCNTEEKLFYLSKNVNYLKDNDLDVAIISPLPIPQNIVELVDYVFITKENPVLDWPQKSMAGWKEFYVDDKKITIWNTFPDYGWAGLLHVKRLGEIFINYDYDYFNFIIYDTIVTKEIAEFMNIGHDAIVFPSKRDNDIWDVGLHFMIFNRENLSKVISRINLEDYLSYGNFEAFSYLYHHIVKYLNIQIGNILVEDYIYYYDNFDIFNFSDLPEVKFFISKPDEYIENIKLFFYDIKLPSKVQILVNNEVIESDINTNQLIDLGINKFEIEKVVVTYNGNHLDITDKIKKIKNTRTVIESL